VKRELPEKLLESDAIIPVASRHDPCPDFGGKAAKYVGKTRILATTGLT
jgi:hypothetical protein